jgi:hypothetical protein
MHRLWVTHQQVLLDGLLANSLGTVPDKVHRLPPEPIDLHHGAMENQHSHWIMMFSAPRSRAGLCRQDY